MRIVLAVFLIVLTAAVNIRSAAAGPNLPVYISDNHGGSFYFIAERVSSSSSYRLLLFDRHTDATAVNGSDIIRSILTEYNHSDKSEIFSEWKKNGMIQCFNWIEPLLPSPIQDVTLIFPEKLSPQKKADIAKKAEYEINFPLFTGKRKVRDLSENYSVSYVDSIRPDRYNGNVIVSIDLDYFTGFAGSEQRRKIREMADFIKKIKNLKLVTIAVSRPYLKGDSEASYLLCNTLNVFLQIVNAEIHFDPFLNIGPDLSSMAYTYYRKKEKVPALNLKSADNSLKSLILQNGDRLMVPSCLKWDELIGNWNSEKFLKPELQIDADYGIVSGSPYRFLKGSEFKICLKNFPDHGKTRVRWFVRKPESSCYNITGNNFFAAGSPNIISFSDKLIKSLNSRIIVRSDELERYFDKGSGAGTIRIFAEIEIGNDLLRTNTLVLVKSLRADYTGYLTELINLPYIFGSCLLRSENGISSDLNYGSDCSSFIIYGKRRLGFDIPYVEPGRLRDYLDKTDSVIFMKDGIAMGRSGRVRISDEEIGRGLIIHLGNHVAALYEDRKPYGILNESDLVIHQLEDYPKIIPFSRLIGGRVKIDLMVFKE